MNTISKLAVCTLFVLGFNQANAQKKVNEGTITYTVNFELPADKQQFAAMMPKEITSYFRGDSTASSIVQGPATIKSVQDYKTNYQLVLIDVPAASKKIVVNLTPADIEEMEASTPKLTPSPTAEKQVIAGYNCTKVIATDAKTGTKYDVWITKDIDLTPNALSRPVSGFGGVPVRFVTFSQGIKVNAEIKEIKQTAVPKGFFTATKDYEPMSMEQLKALTGQ